MPLEQAVMNHTSGVEDVILFNKSRISMFYPSGVLGFDAKWTIIWLYRSLYFHFMDFTDLKDIRYEILKHMHYLLVWS